jgi:hypothetical protein
VDSRVLQNLKDERDGHLPAQSDRLRWFGKLLNILLLCHSYQPALVEG